MNIDSSYTNVQSLNDIRPSALDKVGGTIDISKTSDDISSLSIADQYGFENKSLSQSIQNLNGGIAVSHIAQDGLSSQKDILEEIKDQAEKAMTEEASAEDREVIKKGISKDIEKYNRIAQNTTYNNETVLQTSGDSTDDISVVGDTSIIVMEKVDTTTISDELKSSLTDFASNPVSMKNMLETADKGIKQLATFKNDFETAADSMESAAKEAVSKETNDVSAQSTILNADYSKEITDFSKSNILSQIGKVVASQANAVQSRNIALLS